MPVLDGLLARPCLHVAVDMQRLFAEPTARHPPGLADIPPRFDAQAVVASGAEVPASWRPAGGAS